MAQPRQAQHDQEESQKETAQDVATLEEAIESLKGMPGLTAEAQVQFQDALVKIRRVIGNMTLSGKLNQ